MFHVILSVHVGIKKLNTRLFVYLGDFFVVPEFRIGNTHMSISADMLIGENIGPNIHKVVFGILFDQLGELAVGRGIMEH
jgi:hypothetical protein